MAEDIVRFDERKDKRVPLKYPLSYRIGGMKLRGTTVNASNEGILIKTPLSLETAFAIFKTLDRKSNYLTELEVILEGKICQVDAEIRHFHLDCSGQKPYLFRAGLRFPKDEIRVPGNTHQA